MTDAGWVVVCGLLGIQLATAVIALEHLARELGRIRESIERRERGKSTASE